MHKFIKFAKENYLAYLEPKSLKLIENCFIISIITCLFGLLFLSFYNTYYISISLYESSLIIFRTGLMIGLFPSVFALIIEKWKKDQNL